MMEQQQQQQDCDGSPVQSQNYDARFTAAVAAVATAMASSALPAIAEEDYEYGTVNAPPLIPIIGGILAILTATLPFFLKSGEKAFEEIRERDEQTFGSKDNQDVLKKK